MFGDDVFFDQLRKELPPVFTREFASEKIGRIFSAKSMSNADALGIGPSVKVKIGKKVGYERDSFLFIWNTCGNSIPMEDEGYGTCSADPSEKNYAEKKDPNHRRL